MPDNPTPTAIERDTQIDGTLLSMLVWQENQRPYSLDEIEREMECDPTTQCVKPPSSDCLLRLRSPPAATTSTVSTNGQYRQYARLCDGCR